MTATVTATTVSVGSLSFDILAAGAADGEPVVLLHGFPQSSACWRYQLEALAGAGYRAVAPDQRGYSPGARPDDVASYAVDHLVADVIGLADALGFVRFHLVGHDWGGAVGWALAAADAGRLHSLAVISTPHPGALIAAVPRSLQVLRSSYIALFRLPGLAEALLGPRRCAVLRRLLRLSGLPAPSAHRDAEALCRPGALRAALNWYRANGPGLAAGTGRIGVRTLYVWSTRDPALGRVAAEATAGYVDGPYRFEVLEGVSHWVMEERPDQLNRLLLDHLAGAGPAR
ncbi:MAG: alpha/beta hydrolase [Actinobacteria bacterium]|nr:alpha/beta hydrolase [Actinomycetota bacterium]